MTPKEFRELRERLGFQTRGELAEAMGVSRYCIEHWEYGRRPIPAYAQKLLEYLADKQYNGNTPARGGLIKTRQRLGREAESGIANQLPTEP